MRFFGEGHLGLIFWPRGSLLILGRAPIGAWALTRGNTVFELSLVKTFFNLKTCLQWVKVIMTNENLNYCTWSTLQVTNRYNEKAKHVNNVSLIP